VRRQCRRRTAKALPGDGDGRRGSSGSSRHLVRSPTWLGDQPAASVAGVPSYALMEDPHSLEIDVVGGGRPEEEQQIAQVGY